jgi:hypothetical protein
MREQRKNIPKICRNDEIFLSISAKNISALYFLGATAKMWVQH